MQSHASEPIALPVVRPGTTPSRPLEGGARGVGDRTGGVSGTTAGAATSSLTCRVVTDAAQMHALRPVWEALQISSAANEPMLSPVWLFPWWEIYGANTGRELRIGLFQEGDRLVGLAPLHWRHYRYRRCIPFQRLEPLGANTEEPDGVCSEYLNLIIERGFEERVAQALGDALAGGVFGEWDELVLPAMDGDGPVPALLANSFRRIGLGVECSATDVSPYLSLPTTWDAYLDSLGKKKKRNLLRALREFENWAGHDVEYRRARSTDELERGKQILIELHGERWQASGVSGMFQSTRFRSFHDRVMSELLKLEALELTWLTVRGEPVAALYQIVWNKKVYFYQCGRSLDVPRNLSPGTVILLYALRRAIDAQWREFDFLAGQAFYKSQLALGVRPLVQVRGYRNSLRERMRQWCERGIASTRRVRRATRSAFQWLCSKVRRLVHWSPEIVK